MSDWLFTHGDVDGICSGAITFAANPKAHVFFTHPFGLLDDLAQVKDNENVVICDISLSEPHLPKILERFAEITRGGNLTYIDHHPLPKNILTSEIPGLIVHRLGSSSSELSYSHYHNFLDEVHSRIAIYGAVADYMDDTQLVQLLLKRWDKRTLRFEAGILVQGIEGRKRDYKLKKKILTGLAKNIPPIFFEKLVGYAILTTREEDSILQKIKNKVQVHNHVAYVIGIPFSMGKTAIYARGVSDSLVGIACEYRNEMIDMSLRAVEKSIDLNQILRRLAPEVGGSGGGHPSAAGARIPKEKLYSFIEKLDNAIIST